MNSGGDFWTYSTDDAGEKHEDATFVNVVCWNRLAEVAAEYLDQGSPALIEGRLHQQSCETDDGQRRYKMEVVARSVQFLGKGRQDAAGQAIFLKHSNCFQAGFFRARSLAGS